MTSSLSRKELELQQYVGRTQDLEEEVGYLKVNHGTFQAQYEELTECRQEAIK